MSDVSGRIFLDTNVPRHAYDRGAPRHKRERSRELLREALGGAPFATSPQVLGEFFATVTRKVDEPLSTEAAVRVVSQLNQLDIIALDGTLALRAIEVHERYQVSYWDGLILAAAERGRRAAVYSEDLSHGQDSFGVQVIHPFIG